MLRDGAVLGMSLQLLQLQSKALRTGRTTATGATTQFTGKRWGPIYRTKPAMARQDGDGAGSHPGLAQAGSQRRTSRR